MSVIREDMKRTVDKGVLNPELLRGKKFLLLGSTGMILSYMARFLTEMNDEYQLDMRILLQGRSAARLRARHGYLEDRDGVSFEAFDISAGIPENISVDYIIHGASPANGTFFIKRPVDTIMPNVLGTRSVLEYAKEKKARVLYMSSTAIYGDVSGIAKQYISENDYGIVDPLDERASYYESKRLGEQMCSAYSRQYGVSASVARIPYTYGPSYDLEADLRIFPRCIKKILAGEEVELFHEDTLLQYTYAADVASALLIGLQNGESGQAYNVCRLDGMSMEDMVKNIAEANPHGSKAEIIIKGNDADYYFKDKKTVNLQWMSNEKLVSIGWKSCFDFPLGLAQTIRGIKEFNSIGADK